jgi:hypothetical protein
MEVCVNHRELHICSKTMRDSFILFYVIRFRQRDTTYGIRVFLQDFIITGYSDKENTSGDILKAVDPLSSFRPLSTNITNSAMS